MASPPLARDARVVHHVPGRLRIRVEERHDEAAFLEQLQGLLKSLSGVESVRINVAAASLVIQYDCADGDFPQRLSSQEALRGWLAFDAAPSGAPRARRCDAAPASPEGDHSHVARALVRATTGLDRSLRQASDGYLDLKLLMPVLAAAASGLSPRRREGTPMWMTLAIFALNSFLSLHRQSSPAPGPASGRPAVPTGPPWLPEART
ncbi:hypothetical protein OOT46_12845 [Aquabacterium sp. A7-Y]|uniref:HMA2 domain-containing protein n=1 Tax=Aquabacterium sp. A7-Y TaxID=1349605 RepID=UPI00223E0A78|nr:hypothetical protein [Aquabacterium sp. A7-Y]MCW7538729.1 hypothetical protein [Aquabacterium sp. A7-Y]